MYTQTDTQPATKLGKLDLLLSGKWKVEVFGSKHFCKHMLLKDGSIKLCGHFGTYADVRSKL